MPASYLLNTPLDDIANHMQLLDRMEAEGLVLDVYNRPGDDYTELTICTMDDSKPGVLSKISGVLYGNAIDILKAQAFTMEEKSSVVLDTLLIRANGMQISEYKARKIRSALRGVLSGAQSMDQFFLQAGKNPPESIALDSIDLRNDLSEEHTIVHIIANDIPGLLYVMSHTLSQCNLPIHSAKVTTWQGHAENNFYITMRYGGQIPDDELPMWTDRLRHRLQSVAEESA
jgi:[protein-PII] uridylyltransferase